MLTLARLGAVNWFSPISPNFGDYYHSYCFRHRSMVDGLGITFRPLHRPILLIFRITTSHRFRVLWVSNQGSILPFWAISWNYWLTPFMPGFYPFAT